ncbi:unnamed protein product [Strongylus vulgaris]|uniref:Uncharacterized protein n=1 Tax=Strongylus vulgaris TaxID=40348 RepID=A0A3P7JBY1_STRVU|nr:unnamed protein product [Strongylus vulgaris]
MAPCALRIIAIVGNLIYHTFVDGQGDRIRSLFSSTFYNRSDAKKFMFY